MNISRLKFLTKRVVESPVSFLINKFLIEFRKLYLMFFLFLSKQGVLNLGLKLKFNAVFAECDYSSLKKIDGFSNRLGFRYDKLSDGYYPCLGFGDFRVTEYINWLEDDIHGITWPLEYFSKIDFVKLNSKCDVKIVWEKNRLQFLVDVGLMQQLYKNNYIEVGIKLLKSWKLQNPLCYGPNWVASMEVSIRALNIYQFYCLTYNELSKNHKKFINEVLSQHLWYLRRFPEISDVQGNHYLFSMLGVFWLEASNKNSTLSYEVLFSKFVSCVAEQFDIHGMHVEKCLPYHRYCLDAVALGLIFAKKINVESYEKVNELTTILRKGVFTCQKLSIGQKLPCFGDNDSGQIFNFFQPSLEFLHLRGLLGEKVEITNEHLNDYFNFLKLMNNGVFSDLEKGSENTFIPPYFHLAGEDISCIVRAGELGLSGRAPHDHDDNISFIMAYKNISFIVEAGCGTYSIEKRERARILASSSHNTISEFGKNRVSTREGSVLASISSSPIAKIVESRTRYVSLKLETKKNSTLLMHNRVLEISNSKLFTIKDNVKFGLTVKRFQSLLHFAPGFKIEISETSKFIKIKNGNISAYLKFTHNCDSLVVQKESYSFSEDYGEYHLAEKIIFLGDISQSTHEQKIEITIEIAME